MSLKFYLGASGSGKSYQLHKDVCEMAKKERNTNFLFIVPDQFTMQTQVDLVKASESGGIMNIDVLSFNRLAHRIFEETGDKDRIVLDDTGKNLVIRALSSELSDRMEVLGKNLNKAGFIHEIKSVISELKQYDISTEKLGDLIAKSKGRRMLNAKLKDIAIVYDAFNKYIKGDYITSEETMSLLTEVLDRSKIIRDSIVIFDGFTGFTPIQYRLIRRLLELTRQVIVSVTIDIESSPYQMRGEQELFYLSRKTIADLQKCSEEVNIKQAPDVLLKDNPRFKNSPEIDHLEKSLFRYPIKTYDKEVNAISITECPDISSEVNDVCVKIKDLVLDQKYEYRDIAIVCGDLDSYADELRYAFNVHDIPGFIDRTSGILLNPITECIRSALIILRDDFSYASVFHYLKSGIGTIEDDMIDRLDNYVVSCGIRGRKRYEDIFTRIVGKRPDEEITDVMLKDLSDLNESRMRILESLSPLLALKKKDSVADFVDALKEFIRINDIERKTSEYASYFASVNDNERSAEFSQIIPLIYDLLDKIKTLLSEETIDTDEFIHLLDSGFDEIDVGSIPGGIDKVLVGDIERSRLSEVKVLFFVGVNDGSIPRATQKGGIISDNDREFLRDLNIELSPSPREKMYIQRLYLYMNMTKPTDRLYVSYSRTGSDRKALKASYLIFVLKKLFPKINTDCPVTSKDPLLSITGDKDAVSLLASIIDRAENNKDEIGTLIKVLSEDPKTKERVKDITEASLYEYVPENLKSDITSLVYKDVLKGSVSRIERYYMCPYSHFLMYGLNLRETDEYELEYRDFGNIYHEVLQRVSEDLRGRGYSLRDFPDELADELIRKELDSAGKAYGELVFYSSKRNEYALGRMYHTLKKNLGVFKRQLSGGEFLPEFFEYAFSEETELDKNAKMILRGRIDRIDLCKDNGCIFTKVIDFKSGKKDFGFDRLYYGIQLQQSVYMNSALKILEKRFPGETPVMGAMLYCHIDDPIIESSLDDDKESIDKKVIKELRPSGIISDDPAVISHLDNNMFGSEPYSSSYIPAGNNKDGELSGRSSVISPEDYKILSRFTEQKIKESGNGILNGDIAVSPCRIKNTDSCKYCAFKDICRFDEKIKGFSKRNLKSMNKEEAMEKIRKCL